MTTRVFFIGDTHFGHKNILKYTRPQFASIEEHNAVLIDNWNKTVRPNDTVWHLGDFCFGRLNLNLAARLNGNKRLVLGNHDMYPATVYLQYFKSLHGATEYKGGVLSHIPVHPDQFYRYRFNIHGHLHTEVVEDVRYKNVSVERINFTPISLEEIFAV